MTILFEAPLGDWKTTKFLCELHAKLEQPQGQLQLIVAHHPIQISDIAHRSIPVPTIKHVPPLRFWVAKL